MERAHMTDVHEQLEKEARWGDDLRTIASARAAAEWHLVPLRICFRFLIGFCTYGGFAAAVISAISGNALTLLLGLVMIFTGLATRVFAAHMGRTINEELQNFINLHKVIEASVITTELSAFLLQEHRVDVVFESLDWDGATGRYWLVLSARKYGYDPKCLALVSVDSGVCRLMSKDSKEDEWTLLVGFGHLFGESN